MHKISTKQLNCPPTKTASLQAANLWWVAKRAEIDGSQPPQYYTNEQIKAVLGQLGVEGLQSLVVKGSAAETILTQLMAAGESQVGNTTTIDINEGVEKMLNGSAVMFPDERLDYAARTLLPNEQTDAIAGLSSPQATAKRLRQSVRFHVDAASCNRRPIRLSSIPSRSQHLHRPPLPVAPLCSSGVHLAHPGKANSGHCHFPPGSVLNPRNFLHLSLLTMRHMFTERVR